MQVGGAIQMLGVLSVALAVAATQPIHELTTRAQDGTTATITYWLKPSPRGSDDAVGPIVGGGTLRIISPTHSFSIPLSHLGMASEGRKWIQFVTSPRMACYAQPVSVGHDSNGRDAVTIRYAFVGKGCLARTTVIDATTGAVTSSQ
jgi:hypothetical protein